MKGWKTWAGAGIIGLAAALTWLGYDDIAKIVLMIGGMFGLIGLGHKIEKTKG